MSNEKLVYVPRSWMVSFNDANGVLHENVMLKANREYAIVTDGKKIVITVVGIRSNEETSKEYILSKIVLHDGYMRVMEKQEVAIDLDTVTEITEVKSKYVKAARSIKTMGKDTQAFTFAFDSEKYSSQYRITVYAQEFVALALKSESDFNKKSGTIYGEIKDVIPENNEILIYRYVSNKGVRDVYPMSIDLSSLLGVYRYDLEIEYKDTSEDEEETESNEKSPE